MAEKKSFWKKEALWATIVGGIVVWGVIEALTAGRLLPTFRGWIKAVGGFFASPITIPLWGAILLPIAGAVGIIGMIALSLRRRKSAEDEFKAYTSDRFFDVDWGWEWVKEKIVNPMMLCPEYLHVASRGAVSLVACLSVVARRGAPALVVSGFCT